MTARPKWAVVAIDDGGEVVTLRLTRCRWWADRYRTAVDRALTRNHVLGIVIGVEPAGLHALRWLVDNSHHRGVGDE